MNIVSASRDEIAVRARGFLIDRKLGKVKKLLVESEATGERLGPELKEYNARLRPRRALMKRRVEAIFAAMRAEPRSRRAPMLHYSLIHFSAIGEKMVEKAEAWLIDWGNALIEAGHSEIGEAYLKHATEERGHDQWHKKDVHTLVKIFGERYGIRLDADGFRQGGRAPCVDRYVALSEDRIGTAHAALSLAELYETELLAMAYAPEFIGLCVRELGFGIQKGLVFLRGHVVSDVDHIRDNAIQLDKFLRHEPHALDELVEVAGETMSVYENYFDEVWQRARESYEKLG